MVDEKDNTYEEMDDTDEWYEHYRIIVDKGQSSIRIDKFLMDRIQNATRSKIQNAIHVSSVQVNGKSVKPSYQIKPLDVITISLPKPPREDVIIPEAIPLNIIYEDESLLIVNKPAGMVVHPAYNNWTGTLVNALVYHFQQLPTTQNGSGRPGLVHRIDKDTSGLLVIAKTELAMTALAKQFYDHSIERTYWALVWGLFDSDHGTINVAIGRSPKDRRVMTAFPEGEYGKDAITHYKVIQSYRYVSLVECKLETGRTHQIRAHMQYIGHPIFNDSVYGGDQIRKGTVFSKYKSFVENCFALIPRQALHAKTLGFKHPETGERMQFDSPLPADFQQALAKWENYVKYN